jgi:two-component system cell cycle response regulator
MAMDKILIVEDDPANLDLMGTYIDSFGYPYESAVDGRDAVEKLQDGSITIVITDIIMPRMDGMQLLEYVREHHPNIGVIVVTGFSDSFSYTTLIKAGASDFISKPFNVDELEAKLNRLVRELSLVRRLEQYSISDPLTGLYNRRYFDDKILTEVQRAERQKYSVFLQMIDVDNMKLHNDSVGHQAGDKLLQELSQIIQESIRANVDWSFRYGGDEFGVISTQVEFAQMVSVAQRIQEQYNLRNFAGTWLSIGIARFIRHEDKNWQEDITDLVARADKALYSAKHRGKNQIFLDKTSHKRQPDL